MQIVRKRANHPFPSSWGQYNRGKGRRPHSEMRWHYPMGRGVSAWICFQISVRTAMAKDNRDIPCMSAAIKLCAGYFLFKFFPALKIPMKDLELLNVMAQIGDVFGDESIIWKADE